MARKRVSEAEWQTFLSLADRLGIPVRELLQGRPRFTEMESAGHRLGQAVAQVATERMSLARAGQMAGPQPCPTCGAVCELRQQERELTSLDGPLTLTEPVAHCSACRRDFFPSASGTRALSAELQSGSDRQDRVGERRVEVAGQSPQIVAQAGRARRQRVVD
jgi:hypothetical protein